VTEPATIFLLSPANLSGRRGEILLNPGAKFELARRLRSPEGAPLGELFSFVSGLYFRGKVSYARAFGRAPEGKPSSFVMTAGGGLCRLDESVSIERIKGWQNVAVSAENPHFTAPLVRHTSELLDTYGGAARFVLLGSVASRKYVTPLREVFGDGLLYPEAFAGLGDMSRGALMLRAASEGRELTYVPLVRASRW
jgi:hypothetical protein